ncbi:hypothetical protein ACIF80_25585 [Streptomyces sp. NPDC085927]
MERQPVRTLIPRGAAALWSGTVAPVVPTIAAARPARRTRHA